jgi:hypothetical protein
MATAKPREPRLSHDRRILLMAFASALPGALISLIFLWTGDFTPKVQWTLSVIIVAFCLGFGFALRERVILPLQTLSNLLAALGEGDFSIRARGARGGDALGEVMIEVNTLVETLRHQRLDALEATTLLRKVMAEIEVAVFTFDEERVLKFVNRAGGAPPAPERRADARAARRGARARRLSSTATRPRVINTAFPGGVGRWEDPAAAPSARAGGRTNCSSSRPQSAAARGRAPGVPAPDSASSATRMNNSLAPDQVDSRAASRRFSSATRRRRLARRHAARARR